jgi:hypothetical protein
VNCCCGDVEVRQLIGLLLDVTARLTIFGMSMRTAGSNALECKIEVTVRNGLPREYLATSGCVVGMDVAGLCVVVPTLDFYIQNSDGQHC